MKELTSYCQNSSVECNNFTNWKLQLFLVLEHCTVLKIVLGEETKPLPVLDSGNVSNAEAIELWVEKMKVQELQFVERWRSSGKAPFC